MKGPRVSNLRSSTATLTRPRVGRLLPCRCRVSGLAPGLRQTVKNTIRLFTASKTNSSSWVLPTRLQLHLALHAAEPAPDRREGEISGSAQEDFPGGMAAYSLPPPQL